MEQLNLFDIHFPIYSITKTYRRIWSEMNVLYIETEYGIYVLDNKNIQGDTVGKRRLRIKNDIYALYKPRKVLYDITHLIKSKDYIFMDTNGLVFKYKTKINFSYKTNCRNAYAIHYIGLLNSKYGYIPYELSEFYKEPTRRMI